MSAVRREMLFMDVMPMTVTMTEWTRELDSLAASHPLGDAYPACCNESVPPLEYVVHRGRIRAFFGL